MPPRKQSLSSYTCRTVLVAVLATIGISEIRGPIEAQCSCTTPVEQITSEPIKIVFDGAPFYWEHWIRSAGMWTGTFEGTNITVSIESSYWDARAYYSTYRVGEGRERRMGQTESWDFGEPEEETEEWCDLQPETYYWDEDLQQCIPYAPILIPTTTSQAIQLTDIVGGVLFDHDGDGFKESTSWTKAGIEVAFLARDVNGNGTIDSGKELFGASTVPGKSNGFSALRAVSGVQKGSLTPDDPFFAELLLWTDRNHNGFSEASELRPANDVLAAIGLGYEGHNRRDGHGNLFRYKGWAVIKGSKPYYAMELREMQARRLPIYDVILMAR